MSDLTRVGAVTGHAIVCVDAGGENLIVIHGGANRALTVGQIDRALARVRPGDWLLAQNETSLIAEGFARALGLRTAYAAALFAAAAAALQVTRPGAADAIPTGPEVAAFLAERGG